MSLAISPISALTLEQIRATAAAARVSVVVAHAPVPPSSPKAIEAGHRAIEAAKAEAETAVNQVRSQQDAVRRGGVMA